jgi:uncharacterized protein (TIGR00290 family)
MKTAVLWTGGKDSALACYKVQKEHEVSLFVNFIWEKTSLSHPFLLTKFQAEAIQKPFIWDKLNPPYFESYRESILELKNEYGIEAVVTGDIAQDTFHGKWIDKVCKDTGVQVIKPLWDQDRETILKELLADGFKAIFTCVKEPWLTPDWLGKTIDTQTLKEIQRIHQTKGLDACGEFGEYHTAVVDAPFFAKAICISAFETQKTEDCFAMEPIGLSLKPKAGR